MNGHFKNSLAHQDVDAVTTTAQPDLLNVLNHASEFDLSVESIPAEESLFFAGRFDVLFEHAPDAMVIWISADAFFTST